ncbi:MAG: hypothetical protein ED555_07480 [Allomuricauda sp.]|nr:MAG: hypothetical protein ED555_07480 [Allomuricauda sp.]
MKNKYLLVLCAILLLGISCRNKPTSKSVGEDDSEIVVSSRQDQESLKNNSVENAKDCDDFIDQYEAWSQEYVAFLSKYKDDPMKAVTSKEYQEMMQRASSWSQQWLSISVSCAQNSKYEERMQEITDKVEQKIAELGF